MTKIKNSGQRLNGKDTTLKTLKYCPKNRVHPKEHVGGAKGIYFIHGALHLYVADGEVRKQSWIRTKKRLIELVKAGLDKNQYPLFVAEGKPGKKLEQIQRSGYLSYCIGKLERIQQSLVIYGHSLGESDQHILNVIGDNRFLEHVYISVHSSGPKKLKPAVDYMQERRRKVLTKNKKAKELNVYFYDAKTAEVWDTSH